MVIDVRDCKQQPRGFGNWVLTGPRGQQVSYQGWFADAGSYVRECYGPGHWAVSA